MTGMQKERAAAAKKLADTETKLADAVEESLKKGSAADKRCKDMEDEIRYLKEEMHDRGLNYVKVCCVVTPN